MHVFRPHYLHSPVSTLRWMKGVKMYGAGSLTNCKVRSTWITHHHCQSFSQVLLFIYLFICLFIKNRSSSKCSWKNEIQKHTQQRKVKRFKTVLVAYKINRQPRDINWTQLLEEKPFQPCENRHQYDWTEIKNDLTVEQHAAVYALLHFVIVVWVGFLSSP